jgi:hypothetical protein
MPRTLQPPTKKQTLDKIDQYLEWWKTQPSSVAKSNAVSELNHTKRRIQKGWPEATPKEQGQ